MSALGELLDKAKNDAGLTSDNQLSIKLKVSRQAVSAWRNERTTPDTVTCAKIAEITGVSLARVLGIVGEARAISREEKAVWRRLASAAAILLFALPFQGQTAPYGMDEHKPGICIMRSGTVLVRATARTVDSPDCAIQPCHCRIGAWPVWIPNTSSGPRAGKPAHHARITAPLHSWHLFGYAGKVRQRRKKIRVADRTQQKISPSNTHMPDAQAYKAFRGVPAKCATFQSAESGDAGAPSH